MLKIEVKSNGGDVVAIRDQIAKWCIDNIGPSIPRGQHNQKRKKQWDIKIPAYNFNDKHRVNLLIRTPANATLASLRWGN